MTAPVIQEQNQSIAMTIPITQQDDGKSWKIRFIMPSHYTLDTLPEPNNASIKLLELSTKRFAIISFPGAPTNKDLEEKSEELVDWLRRKNLKAIGNPIFAFYNPPWTLPFLRRNEVMVEID